MLAQSFDLVGLRQQRGADLLDLCRCQPAAIREASPSAAIPGLRRGRR